MLPGLERRVQAVGTDVRPYGEPKLIVNAVNECNTLPSDANSALDR